MRAERLGNPSPIRFRFSLERRSPCKGYSAARLSIIYFYSASSCSNFLPINHVSRILLSSSLIVFISRS